MSNTRICLLLLAGLLASCASDLDRPLVAERTRQLYRDSDRWTGSAALSRREVLPKLDEDSDLETYLRFGLLNNPGLRAAFDRWRATLERIPQVTSLPDPTFSYSHFVEAVQTRTGPQRNRFGLSQAFPWFGKLRLRGEVAAMAAESEWFRVEARRLGLLREIKRTYFEYGYLAKAVRISEDNLQLLRRQEPVAQRKVAVGGRQDDLVRLQVEIGKVENHLESLRKRRPALSARLSAALNRHGSDLLPWPTLVEPAIKQLVVAELDSRVRQDNPELAALRQEILRAEQQRSLADLERYPDFSVGLTYLETGGALNPATPGSGDDPIGLNLGFNLPIWGGRYSAASREALRMEESVGNLLRDRINTLGADLRLVYFNLDDGARQLALFRDTLLPRAQQAFTVTETAYRGGTATLLEVIDSQRILLAFENSYWRGVSNYEQSLADLEAICGGEIR
jgi:outer membrane protein TolC